MSLNTIPEVKVVDDVQLMNVRYQYLLGKFPEKYRHKLTMYTCEELYYVYRLALFELKPRRDGFYNASDTFYTSLRAHLFRWLRGEVHNFNPVRPIAPMAWVKLASK